MSFLYLCYTLKFICFVGCLLQETEFKFPDSSADQWGPPPSDMEPSLEKSVIEEDIKQPDDRRSATNGNGSARLRNIDGSEVYDESQGHSWRAVRFITIISDLFVIPLAKTIILDGFELGMICNVCNNFDILRMEFQTPCRLWLHADWHYQIVPGDYLSHFFDLCTSQSVSCNVVLLSQPILNCSLKILGNILVPFNRVTSTKSRCLICCLI
jgi:hypothetical protein